MEEGDGRGGGSGELLNQLPLVGSYSAASFFQACPLYPAFSYLSLGSLVLGAELADEAEEAPKREV